MEDEVTKIPCAHSHIKHADKGEDGCTFQEIFYLIKFIYFKISKIVFVKKFLLLFLKY